MGDAEVIQTPLQLADDLALPLDAVVRKFAILGMSGSGKTQTARRSAETMLAAGIHCVVFAPAGGWWGLRSSADGQKPGFPIVVFGGDHADAPLRPDSGRLLAAAVLKQRFNAIFDMFRMTEPEMRQFAADFLGYLNQHNQNVLHVFLDEFDILCPQEKKAKSEESRAAVNSTVRRGRNSGIGTTMITQNPQDADKSVLNMADIQIVMRTAGSQPIDAIRKWIGRTRSAEEVSNLVTSLPQLATGTGWTSIAEWGIFKETRFLLCETFDSSRTPRPGENIEPPVALAKVDIVTLGKQVEAQAREEQESSPEFLKQRIAALEKQIKAGGETSDMAGLSEHIAQLEKEVESIPGLNARIAELEAGNSTADERLAMARQALDDVRASVERALEALSSTPRAKKPPARAAMKPELVRGRVRAASSGAEDNFAAEDGLSGPALRILGTLRSFRSGGIVSPLRIQVCLFSGYSNLTSSGFVKALGVLKTGGLVEYAGDGTVKITDEGLKQAPAGDAIKKHADLHEKIFGVVTGPEQKILRELISQHPKAVSRDRVMEVAGYSNATSSGFVKAIGHLRSLGYIDYPSKGTIEATAQCFLPKSA